MPTFIIVSTVAVMLTLDEDEYVTKAEIEERYNNFLRRKYYTDKAIAAVR